MAASPGPNVFPPRKTGETSLETPTIHQLNGNRLILFSGLYPIRSAISDDNGATWSPLAPIGDFGGIVAMSSVIKLKNGSDMARFSRPWLLLENRVNYESLRSLQNPLHR